MTSPHSVTNSAPQSATYVHSLDFLRGVLAICVMAYHVLYYEKLANLAVLSYYCVYGFFVLSGMSLYLTYHNRLNTPRENRAFILRRFFRIAPLFWLVCIATVFVLGAPADLLYKSVLNMSLLFGFANPGSTSLITGGWSIGIEFVFYLIFPIIIFMTNNNMLKLTALALASVILSILFTNHTIDPQAAKMTSVIWANYTQPAAFVGYFASGCLLGEIYLRYAPILKGHFLNFLIVSLSLIPFILIQTESPLHLLIGVNGIVLMLSTILLVASFSFLPERSRWFKILALWLGRLSYSIYLLHPLIYRTLRKFENLEQAERLGLTFALTVMLCVLIYYFIEAPARQYGKRLTYLKPPQ